jgi:hypothetical protein
MVRWFLRRLFAIRQHRIDEASDCGTEGLIDLSLLFRDHCAWVPTILSRWVNHRIGPAPGRAQIIGKTFRMLKGDTGTLFISDGKKPAAVGPPASDESAAR